MIALDVLKGYERPTGWGVRNHCVVLSAMDLVNGIVAHIGAIVKGTISVPIWYGRGQYGMDGALMQRTLAGIIRNANVGGVVIVSLEEKSAEELLDVARRSGKLAEAVVVQSVGDSLTAIATGARYAAKMVSRLSMDIRRSLEISDLVVGMECGASDATSGIVANPLVGRIADRIVDAGGTVMFSETAELVGAENALMTRAIDPSVAERIRVIVGRVEEEAERRGVSLLGVNPSPDNIRGGLSSLEEKALGSVAKGGTRTISGVLSYATAPTKPGLYIMDTPSPASESLTGLAAGGCQVFMFSTGQGNPVGFPIVPTIKISANPETTAKHSLDLDCDLSLVLQGLNSLDDAQDALWNELKWVVNGKLTMSEILGMGTLAFNRISPTV